ncbi:MAG: methyltransferase, partial [Aquabacterium sp.]
MSLDEANAAPLQRFCDLLSQSLAQGHCDKLVMANYQGKDAQLGPDLQRVLVRPVELKGQPHLSFVLRYPTKDITKNLPLADGIAQVMAWAQAHTFRNAHLHTPTEEVQLAFSKKGKASVRVGKPSNAEAAQARADAAAAARPGTAALVSAPGEAGSAG